MNALLRSRDDIDLPCCTSKSAGAASFKLSSGKEHSRRHSNSCAPTIELEKGKSRSRSCSPVRLILLQVTSPWSKEGNVPRKLSMTSMSSFSSILFTNNNNSTNNNSINSDPQDEEPVDPTEVSSWDSSCGSQGSLGLAISELQLELQQAKEQFSELQRQLEEEDDEEDAKLPLQQQQQRQTPGSDTGSNSPAASKASVVPFPPKPQRRRPRPRKQRKQLRTKQEWEDLVSMHQQMEGIKSTDEPLTADVLHRRILARKRLNARKLHLKMKVLEAPPETKVQSKLQPRRKSLPTPVTHSPKKVDRRLQRSSSTLNVHFGDGVGKMKDHLRRKAHADKLPSMLNTVKMPTKKPVTPLAVESSSSKPATPPPGKATAVALPPPKPDLARRSSTKSLTQPPAQVKSSDPPPLAAFKPAKTQSNSPRPASPSIPPTSREIASADCPQAAPTSASLTTPPSSAPSLPNAPIMPAKPRGGSNSVPPSTAISATPPSPASTSRTSRPTTPLVPTAPTPIPESTSSTPRTKSKNKPIRPSPLEVDPVTPPPASNSPKESNSHAAPVAPPPQPPNSATVRPIPASPKKQARRPSTTARAHNRSFMDDSMGSFSSIGRISSKKRRESIRLKAEHLPPPEKKKPQKEQEQDPHDSQGEKDFQEILRLMQEPDPVKSEEPSKGEGQAQETPSSSGTPTSPPSRNPTSQRRQARGPSKTTQGRSKSPMHDSMSSVTSLRRCTTRERRESVKLKAEHLPPPEKKQPMKEEQHPDNSLNDSSLNDADFIAIMRLVQQIGPESTEEGERPPKEVGVPANSGTMATPASHPPKHPNSATARPNSSKHQPRRPGTAAQAPTRSLLKRSNSMKMRRQSVKLKAEHLPLPEKKPLNADEQDPNNNCPVPREIVPLQRQRSGPLKREESIKVVVEQPQKKMDPPETRAAAAAVEEKQDAGQLAEQVAESSKPERRSSGAWRNESVSDIDLTAFLRSWASSLTDSLTKLSSSKRSSHKNDDEDSWMD